MTVYNTLLIGMGKIGLGNNEYKKYRSHFYTLLKDKNINLVGVVDKNEKKLLEIKKKYKINCFKNLKDIKNFTFDLIIISTPTNTHYEVALECLRYLKTKTILVEKPLGGDLKKIKIIEKIAKKKNIKIFVNFIRLSLPVTIYLKKILKDKCVNGNVLYSNGLINNATHFINLCIFLFGSIIKVKVNKKLFYNKIDFHAEFILFFKNAEIKFKYSNSMNTKHHIELFSNNLYLKWERQKKIILARKSAKTLEIETKLNVYQYLVIKNLKLFFQKKKFNLCSIKDCIKTLEVTNIIKKHNRKNDDKI